MSTPGLSQRRRRGRGRHGFTLIEILLALALAALVLVSMNTFIFSMSELWGKGTQERLFRKHVRAVTRFVQDTLDSAALPGVYDPNVAPIVPFQVKPADGAAEDMLTFEMETAPRILPWPGQPLPEVVCALGVQTGQGLVFYWHSRLEKNFDTDPPRAYVLSPLVTALSYDYYDSDTKRWVTEPQLRPDDQDGVDIPRRMRLTFSYDGYTEETVVSLPQPTTQGLPVW